MDRFFAGLGRSVVRFRFLVVLLWIVAAVISIKTLPSMSSEVNNDNSQFLSSSAPSSKADALATPLLGNISQDSQVLVVVSRSAGTLTTADQRAISAEVAAIRKVPLVLSAHEAGTAPDGKAAQIIVMARVNAQDIPTQKTLIGNLQAALPPARATAGLQFHLAGTVATNVANQNGSNSTGNKIQIFSLLFIIVLLLVIFRSLLAPLVTLLPAVFALLISMRFIGGLGAHGLKISEITELLLIVLLLGAGTDYGLFLVFRVREEVRGGRAPKDAVAYSLVRVGESISASAGTVILALLTLLLASFGIYKDLGVPLAVGVAVMLLAGLTLLPALLAIFGRAVFWPSRVAPGTGKDGLWGKIAGRLVRRPAITLGIGLAFFLGLASAALGYHSGGFGGATSAPAGSSAAAGNAILARTFPQASANPANLIFRYPHPVWDDPQVLSTADSALHSSSQFTTLSGPLDPNGQALTAAQYARLHTQLGPAAALPPKEPASLRVPAADYNAYRTTSQYVSSDGQIIQFQATLKAGGQQTTAALNATPAIRATVTAAAKASGATESGVAGEAASLYDVSSASNHDLAVIIPVAVLAIGLLLALVLRSLVAPLYLIVSVALSYLAALGVSTLIFIDIGGEGGLTFILPFLMFIFLLALGEDYNILVMTRIREEARQLPLREAVIRAIGRTGPTVTSAGLAGRHVRRAGRRRRQRIGRQPDPGHRRRAGHRHPHGHIPRPDPAGPLHRGPARPVELVAVSDGPAQHRQQPSRHRPCRHQPDRPVTGPQAVSGERMKNDRFPGCRPGAATAPRSRRGADTPSTTRGHDMKTAHMPPPGTTSVPARAAAAADSLIAVEVAARAGLRRRAGQSGHMVNIGSALAEGPPGHCPSRHVRATAAPGKDGA